MPEGGDLVFALLPVTVPLGTLRWYQGPQETQEVDKCSGR
jgi:hypothetical protein